jgi:hypothetical protein
MSSPVSVCNKALALLGANTILSLNDNQTEAIVCKAAYEAVRDKVLEDRAWTFATGRQILDPDSVAPPFGYARRFLIPSTWIRIFKADNPNLNGKLKWEREGDYILCNEMQVFATFIQRVDDISKWSPAAIDAFSYLLASEMSLPITENRALMETYRAIYDNLIIDAGATDGAQGRAEQLRADRLRVGR